MVEVELLLGFLAVVVLVVLSARFATDSRDGEDWGNHSWSEWAGHQSV